MLRSIFSFKLLCLISVLVVAASGGGGSCAVAAAATAARAAATVHVSPPQTTGDEQAKRFIESGVGALERGDVAAAKASFQRALAVEPGNVTAHTYLGVLADRANSLAEAERHFAAAVRAEPSSPAVRNNYGAILLRMGNTRQAAVQFEASLRLDEKQPSALVNLAQIHFASNTPEGLRKARQLFEAADAIAPDQEIARALVIISVRLNDRTSAASYYREYAARPARSAAPGAAAPAGRAELGAALLEAGLAAEAAEELGAAVAAEPSNVEAIVLLARAHLARKDIPAAGRTLEGTVARGIESAPVYAALAEVYQLSGHIENAIPAMRLAIAREPRNEAYRFRYGMLLTDTKAPAAAVIRLEEALREFPQSPRLWFALGVAQVALDKYQEGAASFTRAVELDATLAPALAYLGMTRAQLGQYAEAAALYERALKVDERIAAAHYLLAEALLKETTPDLARVEGHLARAVELDASFAPARLSLGKLYLRTNRLPEAATELERVVSAEPKLAEAHYQLGQVYRRLKRTAEAQNAFATFKQLSDTGREQTRNELREISRRLANVRF